PRTAVRSARSPVSCVRPGWSPGTVLAVVPRTSRASASRSARGMPGVQSDVLLGALQPGADGIVTFSVAAEGGSRGSAGGSGWGQRQRSADARGVRQALSEDLRAVVRQRGIKGAGAAAGRTGTHVVQNAVHGVALAGAPGETGQLPDRTCGEVAGDRRERSVQAGGEVKVTARDGGGGAERRVVHGYRPGAGQSARRDADETALCRCRRILKPADRIRGRCCYRGSGAGEQGRSGHYRDHPSTPSHDLPPCEPASEQNSEGPSVCKPSAWPDRSRQPCRWRTAQAGLVLSLEPSAIRVLSGP